jgi:tripartite ATP-independent transporter DctM subunit
MNPALIQRPVGFLAVFLLAAMVLIPLIEAAGRATFNVGIVGASTFVENLTLWIGLVGAILATLTRQHLQVAVLKTIMKGRKIAALEVVINTAVVCVLIALAYASFQMVQSELESSVLIGGWLPIWTVETILPVAFLLISLITILQQETSWPLRLLTLFLSFALIYLVSQPTLNESQAFLAVGIVVAIVLAFVGLQIYAVLAGLAILLLMGEGTPIAAIPSEAYRTMTQPVLPSIPLFALTGSVLAAGGAARRLLRLVKAWTGWLPGGAAISAVIGCALFTAITGASGVTILALGGLLFPILMESHFKEKYSLGLLTASGSVGLLFPPSLPVILYGVYGRVAIDDLFIASFLPGVLLISMLIAFCIISSPVQAKTTRLFDTREALAAAWAAKWDLFLPVLVLVGLFSGIMTLIETAALAAFWAIIIETVIHREISFRRGLFNTMVDSSVVIGSLLIVVALASGIVSYFVDAQVPEQITAWLERTIESKIIFLLALNLLLFLVGAVMDIFSAIIIVVPLIVPIGIAFDVNPVHLGVIFLANLELGYLTPPVGMNLFLASLRFGKPLLVIWKTVIPFLAIFLAWVVLIIVVPAISEGMVAWIKG